jgi:hypothetical protein
MLDEESDFFVVGKPDIALAPLVFEQVYTREPILSSVRPHVNAEHDCRATDEPRSPPTIEGRASLS